MTAIHLHGMNVIELKAELVKRNMEVTGLKRALIQRLQSVLDDEELDFSTKQKSSETARNAPALYSCGNSYSSEKCSLKKDINIIPVIDETTNSCQIKPMPTYFQAVEKIASALANGHNAIEGEKLEFKTQVLKLCPTKDIPPIRSLPQSVEFGKLAAEDKIQKRMQRFGQVQDASSSKKRQKKDNSAPNPLFKTEHVYSPRDIMNCTIKRSLHNIKLPYRSENKTRLHKPQQCSYSYQFPTQSQIDYINSLIMGGLKTKR